MDTSTSDILLICALVAVPFVAAAIIATVAIVRNRRGMLRRNTGVPTGFGIDAAQGNPDASGGVELHHQHHHHHSAADGGHHHSHGGGDSGGSHHGGGSDGGGGHGGGHH